MAVDLAVELIQATVQLEASYGDGTRNVGTGFLISAPDAEGAPHIVLVTAGHVLERMPGAVMTIGYRTAGENGAWKYQPQKVEIRRDGRPLWVTAADHDVSAVEVEPTAEVRADAIPISWLADDDAFDAADIGPGDEMMALGYPWGLSANGAGFPILRAGKVASYPIAPTWQYPTFLLDFSVFPGNSGGPVFVREGKGADARLLVTGIMTQQLEMNDQPLEIGVVTQAQFVRQAIAELDKPGLRQVAHNVDSAGRPFAAQPEVMSASSGGIQVSR